MLIVKTRREAKAAQAPRLQQPLVAESEILVEVYWAVDQATLQAEAAPQVQATRPEAVKAVKHKVARVVRPADS